MEIGDLLSEECISLDLIAKDKQEAIEKTACLMMNSGNVADKDEYIKCLLAREAEGSTAVGEGVAIPHAKTPVVKKATLAAAVIREGVDFDSPDDEKVKLLFMIAAEEKEDNAHLAILSRLATLLMDEQFVSSLLAAKTKTQFLSAIKNFSRKGEKESENDYSLLAVTACPTGIAHTYMAAEELSKTAKRLGVSLKVETHGQAGIQNQLTQEEIQRADCIIVAADRAVDLSKFDGKKVLFAKVADGINKSEQLILKAKEGNVPVYKSQRKNKVEEKAKDGFIHTLYKSVMSGVSHMLPFIVAGGLLTAFAYLIDMICGNAGTANFGQVNKVAYCFKKLGEVSLSFMIPVMAGFIAYSIADRPGIVVGFIGGGLAVLPDMNFAYLFFGLQTGAAAGFLGGMLAGLVGGALTKGIIRLLTPIPKSMDGIKTMLLYPLIGVFAIGVFMLIFNVPVMFITIGLSKLLTFIYISGFSWLLCMLLAAMMAADLGGPINKTAYLFAAALLEETVSGDASGGYEVMAAVMLGGMIPPLVTSLSAWLFPSKFTLAERKQAPVSCIMGLSFVTEGAISYAATDPVRVIPCCILGSGIGGLLSGVFECILLAPHGGIFVAVTVMSEKFGAWGILLYLLSLVVGSFVGAVVLGIVKKSKRTENNDKI